MKTAKVWVVTHGEFGLIGVSFSRSSEQVRKKVQKYLLGQGEFNESTAAQIARQCDISRPIVL